MTQKMDEIKKKVISDTCLTYLLGSIIEIYNIFSRNDFKTSFKINLL